MRVSVGTETSINAPLLCGLRLFCVCFWGFRLKYCFSRAGDGELARRGRAKVRFCRAIRALRVNARIFRRPAACSVYLPGCSIIYVHFFRTKNSLFAEFAQTRLRQFTYFARVMLFDSNFPPELRVFHLSNVVLTTMFI